MRRQVGKADAVVFIPQVVNKSTALDAGSSNNYIDIDRLVKTRYVRDFKGNGLFWYVRRIPKHAKAHYGGKEQIRKSLKTRDFKVAVMQAAKLIKDDDAFWALLKKRDGSID